MTDEEGANSEVPRVQSMEDFELCRAIKDKGKSSAASSASASMLYETLKPSAPIKGLLSNWETLYVQFKDENGVLSLSPIIFCSPNPGDPLPIEVSQPSLLDGEDEEPRRAHTIQESPVAVGKGKRKAPPE